MSEQQAAASGVAPAVPRNYLIDLARVGSVVVVVVFHTLLYKLSLDGNQIVVTPWAPGVVGWALSWLGTIMPVFFVAAGFANTVIVDRAATAGTPYADYLVQRCRRLLGPMTLYLIASTVVSTVPAWVGPTAQAIELSRQFAQVLWFLAVYLLILALAPLAVRAHDRWGWLPMIPLVLATIAVDAWSFAVGDHMVRWLNLLFVWPLAHQWGIAYHRGWFRRWRIRANVAVIAGSALVIGVLVFALGYPPTAVGWADIPIGNVQPATIAIAVLGLAQTGALGILERRGVGRTLPARAVGAVGLANALLFTVYLWHIPAILLAGSALWGLAVLWPSAAALLLSQPVFVLLVLTTVAVVMPWIARVELALIPRLGAEPARPMQVYLGFGLLLAGTTAVWQAGMVVHAAAPISSIGVLVLAFGIVVTGRAAHPAATAPLD